METFRQNREAVLSEYSHSFQITSAFFRCPVFLDNLPDAFWIKSLRSQIIYMDNAGCRSDIIIIDIYIDSDNETDIQIARERFDLLKEENEQILLVSDLSTAFYRPNIHLHSFLD